MGMALKIIPISLGFVKVFLIKGERGSVLVDSGLPSSHIKILKGMEAAGVSPGDVKLIVITHAHGDHTGALAELAGVTGAKVAVHKADSGYVEKGESAPTLPRNSSGRIASKLFSGRPMSLPPYAPDIMFDADTDLSTYGFDIKVLHTPGHTAGSICLVLDGGIGKGPVIVAGDTLGGGMVLQGVPGLPMFALDEAQLRKSVDRVKSLEPSVVHTAHGGPFTWSRIKGL